MTVPCREIKNASPLPSVVNPLDSNFALANYAQNIAFNRGQTGSDDTCMVDGRHTIGTMGNMASLAWSPGNHELSVGLGWYVNFARPLEPRADLLGMNASSFGLSDSTMGRIAYSYIIPVDFSLVVSGGVQSFQSTYSKDHHFNFPFFDFVTPGKNQTQIFIQLTAGI
jgi:hypothetical protein